MYRQVEAGYLASQGQFDDQLQRDVNQQMFQMSLQRDIERSLSNNPDFAASVPMPGVGFTENQNVPGAAFATMWKNAQARGQRRSACSSRTQRTRFAECSFE